MDVRFRSLSIILKSIFPLFLFFDAASAADSVDVWSGQGHDDQGNLIFLTPTRMGQLIEDIPGTVTVITRDDVKVRGIENIPEALRLVPGMSVLEITANSQLTGHDYRVGYHGGSALLPRRLQVQIDSMSVYLGALSKIDWSQLPVTIDDIERIEVLRNPSAASYGANAFQATINIITRHSIDVPNNELNANVSKRGEALYYKGAFSFGDSSLSFGASTTRDDGYDDLEVSNPDRDTATGSRDDAKVDRFLARYDGYIDQNTELMLQAGYVEADYQTEFVFDGQVEDVYPDIANNDAFVNGHLKVIHSNRSETSLKAYFKRSELEQDFRACIPAILSLQESFDLNASNPYYFETLLNGGMPTGGSERDDVLLMALLTKIASLGPTVSQSVCATTNQDYVDKRTHLSTEHYRFLSNNLRLFSGFSYDQIDGYSRSYFNGTERTETYSIFGNLEWKPTEDFTYNVGMMAESPKNIGKTLISPRVSVNWHQSKSLTYRIVYNTSYRSPDLLETNRFWNYQLTNIQPRLGGSSKGIFTYTAFSEDFDLEAEKVEAVELGALYRTWEHRLVFNGRVFYENLSNLISEEPAFEIYHLTNNGNGHIKGVEIDGVFSVTPMLVLNFGYSYQDHDFSSQNENGLNATHSGNAAIIYKMKNESVSFGYIGNSKMSGGSLDIWNLTYLKKFDFSKNSHITVSSSIEYQPSDVEYLYEFERYSYSDEYNIRIGASIVF
ncbi:TonB-dependent receptor plug domain-containing protein [Hahella ganghwensis]|uniref:TonB-dependent receptor plug domain-containing protein n=1 Tax=Hahella ganghwensis TaxID=286420 RepID=UPI00035FB3EB|nr:TonB-dependent receptor [Hahella ganghwensis]